MEEDIKVFLNAFEEVFDRDWKYSKEMMGILDETEEQKQFNKQLGLETIEIISAEGTFLNPKVEDEIEDWGNRGELLIQYRRLKEKLETNSQ